MTGKEAKERIKKQYDRQNQFIKDSYDRISVTAPKGTKAQVKDLLQDGESINGIVNGLLDSWITARKALFSDSDDLPFS